MFYVTSPSYVTSSENIKKLSIKCFDRRLYFIKKYTKRYKEQNYKAAIKLTLSWRRIETSPLICGANQWTSFYMITASVMKGLISLVSYVINITVKEKHNLRSNFLNTISIQSSSSLFSQSSKVKSSTSYSLDTNIILISLGNISLTQSTYPPFSNPSIALSFTYC